MLQRKYDLTHDEYLELSDSQNGCCAICNIDPGIDKNLHVDHDHETGKVRGLLCTQCNSGLGMFKDRIRLLASAIVYLEDHGKSY